MVPARKGTTFEVIESELTFEVLIQALGSPALLEQADDLLFAHASAQRGEKKLGRFLLIFRPFSDEPKRLTSSESNAVVMRGSDAHETEARTESPFGAITPAQPAKCFLRQCSQEPFDRFGFGVDAIAAIESHDAECWQHAHGEVES